MSQKIDPKEVLIYLNELGYTNISAQQLKEFIIDLKKIIKYEHRKRKMLGHNLDPSHDYRYTTPVQPKQKISQNSGIFEALHNHPTEAFKAKMVNKREHQIAVHITQAKKKNIEHEHCVHLDNNDENYQHMFYLNPKNDSSPESAQTSKDNVVQTESSKNLESEVSTTKNLRPTSKQSLNSSSVPSSNLKKSRTAVLKNKLANKPLKKSDPVALYHQYQQEWKNIKFPGEDNHLDLRWAIRDKLMNGPPVEKPLKISSSRKNTF